MDAPQEEADIFKPTSNHFKQDEHDQAPPHPIQDDTVDDEPIARQTQGMLQHQQFVANEATEDEELVAFLAEMCGDTMYLAQEIRQQQMGNWENQLLIKSIRII